MSGMYGDGNSGNSFGSQPSNNNPFSNTGASGGKSAFDLPGDQYKNIASQGRYGDTMLAHISPEEAALLKSRGGAGTVNPQTGLPEFFGVYQAQQMELERQMAAERAAAAAKAKAAAAPRVVQTEEERQARIARDLALSQIRGARPSSQDSQFYQPAYQPQYNNYATTNPLGVSQYGTPMTIQSLVDSAYAGVGRFGVGTGTNQMDAVGRQNHINAFQTGEYTPENFFQKFANSVRDYQTQNPNDRYTQYMQNQPGYMGGYQGYMPQMQNPFSSSGGMGGGMGGGLTPEMARTLMQRSMTSSGVPTSEFQKFGGYDTVKALYDKSGGDYSGQGNPYPQQQFNPYTNQYQSPFSYQQPQFQQQMQTPFSYQQPSYGGMGGFGGGYGGGMGGYGQQAQRGSAMNQRGAPAATRRAEGGITSLLDNDE